MRLSFSSAVESRYALSMPAAAFALLCLGGLALPAFAERSAAFLFGPGGAEESRLAAKAASSTVRMWLKQPGSVAEIRRAGGGDPAPLDGGATRKVLEEMFLAAARESREVDANDFLIAVDSAAQAPARQPGTRLLVAVVERPSLSGQAEDTLAGIVEFCQANAVRVIVVDPAPSTPFAPLSARTGGSLVRRAKFLDNAKSQIKFE